LNKTSREKPAKQQNLWNKTSKVKPAWQQNLLDKTSREKPNGSKIIEQNL